MTITPSYPVFVAKLSIPRQSQVKTPGDSNFWIEFFWHDPYTGKQDVDLPNNGGGGFWGFTKLWMW